MSFILDALKKSENERQQQATTEFATIPSATTAPTAPRWIWVLIGLLAVNIAVVAIAMLRPDADPVTSRVQPAAEVPVARTATAAEGASFAERIGTVEVPQRPAASRAETPAPAQAAPKRRSTTSVEPAADRPQPMVDADSSLALPTLNEVRLNDGIALPDLHLDIHLYSTAVADRFVFINMQRLKEGSVLDAGPRVDEITPDGVILDYRGTRFVLPRE